MGKSNKVALVCQVCGATFYKVPSAITVETRCCSKECRGKVQAERLEQRRRELAKRLPHRLVRIRITAKVPVWPEYQPRIGATYRAERYPMFKAPGYVIESGGKRINIRANECVEV